jgi:penicillin amidase
MKLIKKDRAALAVLLLLSLFSALGTAAGAWEDGRKSSFSKQTLRVNGDEVSIIRDGFGVPHIFAGTEMGAYYGGGYATAADRLSQMDRFRLEARGQLAELDGPSAFLHDLHMRRNHPTEAEAQAIYGSLAEGVQRSIKSYTDGVNKYLEERRETGELPSNFSQADRGGPQPWRVTDTVLVGCVLAERFGSRGVSSPANLAILKLLRAKFGGQAEAMFNDLFWENDPRAPVTINDELSTGRQNNSKGRRPSVRPDPALDSISIEALAEAHRAGNETAALQYAETHNLPTKLGSYAWAISPKLSASGCALLVGGPQMGFTTPSIAYEIHYCGGDLDVIGMAVAGIPGVVIGHNRRVAWTITSGVSDTKVVYAEQLNPQNNEQYLYKGSYHDMEKHVEVFKVKGEQPRTVTMRRTVHGPLLYEAWPGEGDNLIAFSRHALYADHEFDAFSALYSINRASDLNQMTSAVEKIYTNQNFIAATVDGNIGYWHSGRHKVPPSGVDRRFPMPGTGEYDQIRYLPQSQIPHVINPRQGFIMNWNSKPARDWGNGDIAIWGEANGGRRIDELLRSREVTTFEDARDVAEDIASYEPLAPLLLPILIQSIESTGAAQSDSRARDAVRYLRAWNMHAIDGSVAKAIFAEWLNQLRNGFFGEYFDDIKTLATPFESPAIYNAIVSDSFILHVLQGSKSAVPPSYDYFKGRKREEVLAENFRKALDKLAGERGPQMNLWSFAQPEISFIHAAGIPRTNRGTYILAVEMSEPVMRCVSVLPPGESEDTNSPHFADQRELAGSWRYKTLLYDRKDLEQRAGGRESSN